MFVIWMANYTYRQRWKTTTLDNPSSLSGGKKDNLFQKNLYPRSGFVFDDHVAEVFDDMLHRSIPHYREVMGMSQEFLLQGPGGILYDLGSSTGNFLLSLAARDTLGKWEYRGIDNSSAMVKKASENFKAQKENHLLNSQVEMQFFCADLLDYSYQSCGGVTLHYTLQFIAPERREELLKKIHQALMPTGVLVLSEKVEESSSQLKDLFIKCYYKFKASNDYTRKEIARKKEALEKVLIPSTPHGYIKLLQEVGFREVAVAFKWYNFITLFAIK